MNKELKFRMHINIRAAMASKMAAHIKAISTATKGPPVKGLHKMKRNALVHAQR